MVRMIIDTIEAANVAHDELVRRLHAGDGTGAIAFADDLVPAGDHFRMVTQLKAIALTEGGAALGRRDLVERGATLWQDLGPDRSDGIAYNLANAQLSIWEIAVHGDGIAPAWERDRQHLHAARMLYDRVGKNESTPRESRLRALTNAGNSYDIVGRNLDALALYDEALGLDPCFGMALGNRGIALKHFARYMAEHAPSVFRQAAADLDAALANHESILRFGAPAALRHFRDERAALPHEDEPPGPSSAAKWSDDYLQWCRVNELFLHVWHPCLHEQTPHLDPLFFRSVRAGMTESELNRRDDLIDAFNAIKQDYLSARYITWLSTAAESPIRAHSTEVAARSVFVDSITSARWGTRTGMLMQACAATMNVLDKVAGFVHLYFGTSRVRDVYFKSISRPKANKPIDEPLAQALARPEQNIGLIALLDLSCDLEKETTLSRFVDRRHAATHRFVVAHNIAVPPSDDWVERVHWRDLVDESVVQLGIARAALVYLARTIDHHERSISQAVDSSQGPVTFSLPLTDTRGAESF